VKKILTLFLALILTALIPLSAAASTADVSRELLDVQASFQEKTVLDKYEQIIAFSSMEWVYGRELRFPENDGSATTLAKRILAYTASARVPEVFQEPEQLSALQGADGSFGDPETHALAMLALRSAKATYNSPGAYRHLLSLQNQDGSFGASMKETALCVIALSLSDNPDEINAVRIAIDYLAAYRAEGLEDLCWQIVALTDSGVNALNTGDNTRLETLLSYRTKTGAFSLTKDGENQDEDVTVLALLALDAINRDGSAFKRLASDGLLKRYSIEDFRSILYFGIGLLVVSLAFWIYVFLHKKHNKTLEETKTY